MAVHLNGTFLFLLALILLCVQQLIFGSCRNSVKHARSQSKSDLSPELELDFHFGSQVAIFFSIVFELYLNIYLTYNSIVSFQ